MIARLRHTVVVAAALAVPLALFAAGGWARVVPVRTLLISDPAGDRGADGPSANPVLAADGRIVVFDTAATNLVADDHNGAVRDVATVDLRTGRATLLSAGGNGPSSKPAASASGHEVAFVSDASDLAAGDRNGVSDVFYRDDSSATRIVSVATDGTAANGPSGDPDISANGRYVVFTSAATNLVKGDRNGRPDVFIHDVLDSETVRISVPSDEADAKGASGAPAISANGGVVSFASAASNLVSRDTNRIGDVFVRDIPSGRTTRVSVASSGGQQDKAVTAPFVQISDVSGDGRYVVFDSEATNLVSRDANRGSDVFRHDRVTGRTELVSASSTNRQGNNDSVAPAITPDGQFVAFHSFASNLAPGNAPGEDVFIRDLRTATTAIVNVPATGGRRAPELVKQLLQRPAISQSGTRVAFTSTAHGLVGSDENSFEDVFVRLLAPPSSRIVSGPRPSRRPSLIIGADDPLATWFVCKLDAGRRFLCPRGLVRLPAGLSQGRHVVGIRAGGPGMLYDAVGLTVPVMVDRRP